MAKLSRALACFSLAAWLAVVSTAQATCAIGDISRCISQRAPDGSIVQYPRLHWTTIASAARASSNRGFQIAYLRGGMAQVTRNFNAQALGIPGNQVSGLFRQPANAAPILFARFAPGSNELRIDLLRIERGVDGRITVADAVYGPHHGERFIAAQAYLSQSDQRSGMPGHNPLAAWKSANDNIFHDICMQCPDGRGGIDPHTSGVATAIGIAMRQVGAQLGILAVAHEWIDVQEDSGGGLLWSTVTVKVSGYVRPDWWIASPIGAQLGGATSLGVCALVGESPCRPEHIVAAGIQLAPWSGPGLPTDQDRLYYSENSTSGFTVLGYSLITAVLVGAGAYAWGGEMLPMDGIGASTSTELGAGASSIGSAALTGTIGGSTYFAGSDLLHPSAPDQIQSGYLGNTLSAGTMVANAPANEASGSLQSKATSLQISSDLAHGLSGVAKIYQGTCPASQSRTACRSASTGVVQRIGDRVNQ